MRGTAIATTDNSSTEAEVHSDSANLFVQVIDAIGAAHAASFCAVRSPHYLSLCPGEEMTVFPNMSMPTALEAGSEEP